MAIKEDNSFNIMKGKSSVQWLNHLLEDENKVNRSGAKVTLEHIEYLNRKIDELENKNTLKDEYLKKLKERI